jgi:hypothetical protein
MNNDRIKLPAQEWLGYDPERGDIHGYTFEQMRQFAELIVAECCFVGEQYADGLLDSKHYAFVNKKIKQHFGVEQ